jgi:hypothetical protein
VPISITGSVYCGQLPGGRPRTRPATRAYLLMPLALFRKVTSNITRPAAPEAGFPEMPSAAITVPCQGIPELYNPAFFYSFWLLTAAAGHDGYMITGLARQGGAVSAEAPPLPARHGLGTGLSCVRFS